MVWGTYEPETTWMYLDFRKYTLVEGDEQPHWPRCWATQSMKEKNVSLVSGLFLELIYNGAGKVIISFY